MHNNQYIKRAFCSTLFFLICAVCSFANFDPAVQREFIIIDSVHPYNLNPQTASYAPEAQVLSGLYEGLFSYNPVSLEAEPAIAESFKISRDKKTWTVTIRDNIQFSNGDAITAQNVYDSWIALLDPKLRAPFASLFDCVKGAEEYRTGKTNKTDGIGITVKDKRTLIIKLNAPAEHLAKLLCHHAFSVVHSDPNVYSGAFVLKEFSKEHILLEKNTKYWDAANVALPSIRFVLSDDSDANTYLFNIGQADWVAGYINGSQILNPQAAMLSSQFGTEYLFFKAETAPTNNADVRNALIYALPADEIRKNSLIKATSLILQLHGYPEVFGTPDPDIDIAAALLEKAGYNTTDKKLQIRICFADDDNAKARAALLSDAWAKIGVETTSVFLPSSEYISALKTTDANMYSYIWIGDFADPLAFLELFRGSSSLNETGWNNAQFDKLLEEASKITDITKRYEKLAEAEQLLIDDGVIFPISHTVSFNVIDPDTVSGWFDNALDIHPLKYLKIVQPVPADNIVMLPVL